MRRLAGVVLLALAACSTDPEPTASLTGSWVGQPVLLGIEVLTLQLTDDSGQLTGTGTFTSTTAGSPSGTVTLTGIRISNELQVTMQIHTVTGDAQQAFTGAVETDDQFYLLFPRDPGGVRVRFTRQ